MPGHGDHGQRRRLNPPRGDAAAGATALFPLFALTVAGTVPLALGIVGPVLGAVMAPAAPDSTGRAIEAVE